MNTHYNSGARKRDYGGGYYTPSSKKRPPNSDTHLLPHPQKQGHITQPNERLSTQPKYLGATALQAIQILNTQAQNMAQFNTIGSTEVGRTNLIPTDAAQSLGLNPQTSLPPPLTQRPSNTRQSTLDAHVQSHAAQANFPALMDTMALT